MTSSDLPELPASVQRHSSSLLQHEVERLLRLMGGMLADAYVDGCDIMVEQPQHRAASHLVGHLAREIDSGLRELLTAMLPGERQAYLEGLSRERPNSYDPPRPQVIEEICVFLRVPPDANVPRIWKDLAWHGSAHRDALHRPRTLDDRFRKKWNDFAYVILMVGRGFEAVYLTAAPLIDELAAIEQPKKIDMDRLRNRIPQSGVLQDRFFAAAGSGWFAQLRKVGYFSAADSLRSDGDGMVSYTEWPPGPYLARIAAEPSHAANVVAVFEALNTDNPQVGESAADVALIVPPTLAARLAPKIAEFLRPRAQWALPSKASLVAVRLAAESQRAAALAIVNALIPVPERGSSGSRYFPIDSIAPAYCHLGVDIVTLLADRLRAANDDENNKINMAYSQIWRPSIAKDRNGDGRDKIVSALRDACFAVAESAGVTVVIQVLDRYQPTLFTRVSLYLLNLFPEPDLVEQRLTSPEIFAEADFDREYTALLRQQYSQLPEPAQQAVLTLIDVGPTRALTEEALERWRLHHLAKISDNLPDRYREEFDALVAKHGRPNDTDPDDLVFADWPGTHSPFTAAELASMSDDDLTTTLVTWRESGRWRSPTMDGLRNQLQEAIAADPARFSRISRRFIALDPAYTTALLMTLTGVIESWQSTGGTVAPDQPIDLAETLAWPELLAFAHAVIANFQTGPGQSVDQPYGSAWHGCRQHVAELLIAAMQHHAIELQHAGPVFALIRQLAEDPGPVPEQPGDFDDRDPLVEALSTVRSLAIVAVVHFSRWALAHPEAHLEPVYDQVTELLDAHLDPDHDDSIAVRSVYGSFLNTLLLCREDWTRANRDRIFAVTGGSTFAHVAWQSYLRSNRPSQSGYELLHREYGVAVANLQHQHRNDDSDSAQTEATDHLLDHIAALYGWGLIPLDSGPITIVFAPSTPVGLRRRLLEICGEQLAGSSRSTDAIVGRLQALWDWRERELIAGNTDPDELSSIGWWASAHLIPAEWALARLKTVLRKGGAPQPADVIAARLVQLIPSHLSEAVDCVSLLIDAPTDRWFIDGSRVEISSVLSAGVKAADTAVSQHATDTVNRLVARGRTSFADILT